MNKNQTIEEKIQEEVKKSIKTQQADRLSPKIIKKEMFEFAPDLKSKMSISVVFACIGESLGFASYFFAAYMAKTLFTKEFDFEKIWTYAALTFLCLILQKGLTCLSSIKSHRISFTILRNIRQKLGEKLEKAPLGYVEAMPIGYYKALIVERVGALEDWIAHVMPEMPSRMLHPVLATIILLIVDWRLGLACFASLPFILLGMMLMFYKREERMYTWMNSNQDLNSRVVEYVNGINVIKAFGQANNSYEKFTASVKYYFDSTLSWWKSSWISMAILFAFVNSPIIGTLPVGVYLYGQGQITLWTLMLGLILPLAIIPNVFPLIMSMELYSMIETNWRMIRKVMSLPEMVRPEKEVSLDVHKAFEFKEVNFAYEEGIEVLHHANFQVKHKGVFAIVGESGSGKSTIAKLMTGYFDATEGEISYGGVNVKAIPVKQLMREVTYVAQDNFLFDTSLRDNLRIAKPDATEEEIQRALQLAQCEDLIARLPKGLDSDAGDCGNLLSGGERQRFTLARAMLSDARCIILDEATAYADPENEAKIQEALSHLIKDKTLIVVAHRLHTIVGADAIMVLNKGSIDSIGKHEELMEKSKVYQKLWRHYTGNEKKGAEA